MTEQETLILQRILKVLQHDEPTRTRLQNLIRANTATAGQMFSDELLGIPIVKVSLENLNDAQIAHVMKGVLSALTN